MAKKNTTGDYRKHFHNDYKTGRLSYEDPLTQWAHIMVLDEMFELQKRNECLLYKHAVKRYGKKEVDKLIEESFFLKKKSNFNNEECIYCEQIDKHANTSDQKTESLSLIHVWEFTLLSLCWWWKLSLSNNTRSL